MSVEQDFWATAYSEQFIIFEKEKELNRKLYKKLEAMQKKLDKAENDIALRNSWIRGQEKLIKQKDLRIKQLEDELQMCR